MANYYVRPLGGSYGLEDGSDYDNAFNGFADVAGLSATDTIYICGTHTETWVIPTAAVVYRGDYAPDPGILDPTSGSNVLYINGLSNVTIQNITISEIGTTSGILVNGITNGTTLSGITISYTGPDRAIYFLGNAHTNFTISDITINANPTVPGNTQGIYIFGNSATAGSGGSLSNITITGGVSYLKTDTNHVGVHIDDWNGLAATNINVTNMHTGIRLTNSDNNNIEIGSIVTCGMGLKSDATGDGYGVLIEQSSSGNEIRGGLFNGNYQHYVDAATGGSNKVYSNIMINPIVNSISYVANAAGGVIANNTILHEPTDIEGHGIAVQNGGVSTACTIRNNIVTCGTTGTNIQCVAIGGVSGTNYDDVDIDNNNYYVTNSAKLGKIGVTEYTTLSNWQTALIADANVSSNDANSIETDPLLSAGYKIRSTSPAVGLGVDWWTAVSVTPLDYAGESYPTTNINPGAYMGVYALTSVGSMGSSQNIRRLMRRGRPGYR